MDATLSGETTAQAQKQTTKEYKSPPHALRSDLVLPEKPGPLEEQVPGTPGLDQAAQEPRASARLRGVRPSFKLT